MFKVIILIAVVSRLSDARPGPVNPLNVVTVPPNCPSGQEYINGQCREIWRTGNNVQILVQEGSSMDWKNVVTAPPNCPPGQQWINDRCREVWPNNGFQFQPSNVVVVPPNCPAGQEYVNGQCREIWFRIINAAERDFNLQRNIVAASQIIPFSGSSDASSVQASKNNIITVPDQCPIGYKPDANGICREIWTRVIPTMEE